MNAARPIMDVHQAAQYLGVSVDAMYKYASSKVIPAFKLGNRWRFRKSRIDEWMDRESIDQATARAAQNGSNDAKY